MQHVKEVQKYLMSSGVWEIMKIFASDEFAYYMTDLVPNIQTTGCVLLLMTLQEKFFPYKELKDLPDFLENAVDVSNAAFTELQTGPKMFKILDKLVGCPDLTIEEIKEQNTLLLPRPGRN